ncbi:MULTISPECIES: ParA family protein [Corynebacterium]|uniref:Chromosome partitioning protein n=1 Tax=Corynebacterium hadale TaxID=2026255 RepID=A0A269PB93_9CORY|nr:ParA family protein [Corynebacterium hadale]PAJ68952.1 chromosome partitioning protein [Corynebacterium hadale]WKC61366.1 Sporulation initiation inhibitor protein Soj [Corynebacterium hadale]
MDEQNFDDTPIMAAAHRATQMTSGRAKLPKPEQPRVLTIANQKGGVGKTTTAVNMAASLSKQGLKVLVIDLDPQGNASTALGAEHTSGTVSSYEVLIGEAEAADAVQAHAENPNIFCIPATIDLAGAEIELVSMVRREYRLHDAIRRGFLDEHGFDYVFIDCPPSLGLLTINAMTAVDEVLIPIQCEYYALEGVGQLLGNIGMIREHLNHNLHISAILLTMYDARTRLAADVAAEVRDQFGQVVLNNVIPRSVKVSEAPGYGQTVIDYDPGSRGALAYFDAARELANRGDYQPHESTGPIGVSPEVFAELDSDGDAGEDAEGSAGSDGTDGTEG